MALGMNVGLSPGDFVLDGDPAPRPKKGAPMSIAARKWFHVNGSMDQDATWYGGRPQLRRNCVRLGPSSPPQKGGVLPQFSVHVCCGQTAGWIKMALGMEVGLGPGYIVIHWDHAPLPQEGAEPPTTLC